MSNLRKLTLLCTWVVLVACGQAPGSVQLAHAWPVQVTYDVSRLRSDATIAYTETHWFHANSWEQWTDVLLAFPVGEPCPVRYPALTEEPAESAPPATDPWCAPVDRAGQVLSSLGDGSYVDGRLAEPPDLGTVDRPPLLQLADDPQASLPGAETFTPPPGAPLAPSLGMFDPASHDQQYINAPQGDAATRAAAVAERLDISADRLRYIEYSSESVRWSAVIDNLTRVPVESSLSDGRGLNSEMQATSLQFGVD